MSTIYIAVGNRTSKTVLPAGATYNYSYDPIYELTQATLTSEPLLFFLGRAVRNACPPGSP